MEQNKNNETYLLNHLVTALQNHITGLLKYSVQCYSVKLSLAQNSSH